MLPPRQGGRVVGVHDQADDEDPRLPEGVITLLLTDVEGSTRAWEAHPEAMSGALARHDALIAKAVHAHRGLLIKSRGEGDATFSVFPRATDAALAALVLQRSMTAEPWPDPFRCRCESRSTPVRRSCGMATTSARRSTAPRVAGGGARRRDPVLPSHRRRHRRRPAAGRHLD